MLSKPIKEMTILEKTNMAYDLMKDDDAVKGQAAQVETLLEKLKSEDITVAVIGQFKRGKSALANRILGDDVLPVGIVPITSAVTKVRYGKRQAEVHYENGVVEPVEFERLHEFISEQENSNNELGVQSVELKTPSKFLKNGLTFVDTPGVGSYHKNNTEVAYEHMKESDAVIFLLSVDSPINQIEIDFLKNTKEFAAKFYFAVNKIDVVSEAELKAYTDYCGMLLKQLMGKDDVRLFPVSAKTGQGIDDLKDAVLRDCKKNTREIMEASTAKKLADVINSAATQLDFYWSAMNLEYKELDKRFAAINKTLEDVRGKADACEGNFDVHLNEYKLMLSETVKDLFGMEYHYEIDTVRYGVIDMDREDFLKNVDDLCDDLTKTLDRILLYREENAYTVCHRINAINRLSRNLRRIRDSLTGERR
ncbi:dynamin family protein [Aminicella lysinilytica]|uniref:dynamin family protein n=1 Tax=Aminicella lysinilytica TaxID=433323 RepID=UPI0026EE8732|nr:dynamin family protein [Aminicella lysinilytica]